MSDLSPRSSFPETHWSLIQRVRNDDGKKPEALEEWCRAYWQPVYCYIRAQGRSVDEADEMTQIFFEKLLVRGTEASLPEQLNGSFRAYLMRSIKHLLTDQWRGLQRQKRGAGATHFPVEDFDNLRDLKATPDEAFSRNWAMTILTRALARLEDEMQTKGREKFFQAVAGLLDERKVGDENREEIVKSFGLSDGAFRAALHRLRLRFRHMIEEEIRQTVSSEEEFQEEIRYLFSVWS